MINVGILGGSSPNAGELIRILVNHPDVMLRQIYEPGAAGRDIISAHHGLIGECMLKFSDIFDPDKLDVVFIASDNADNISNLLPTLTDVPDLKVIDMCSEFYEARQRDPLIVYGVPEVNRKALVRGATHAVIPPAVETIAAIAMYPLALRSMLPPVIDLNIECDNKLDVMQNIVTSHVSDLFSLAGNAVAPQIRVNHKDVNLGRVIRLTAHIDLPLPIDNIADLYEEIYDDHNLTHIVGEPIDAKEAEGTDKCIITLDKTADGQLMIQAIADARMRGGAGDAVHVMNLLTGLYEKTGLALKASQF